MVSVLEYGTDEVREEGGARSVDCFPDVEGYSVGARGGGTGGPGESGSDFLLANRAVVGVSREVNVCAGRGRRGGEELI